MVKNKQTGFLIVVLMPEMNFERNIGHHHKPENKKPSTVWGEFRHKTCPIQFKVHIPPGKVVGDY